MRCTGSNRTQIESISCVGISLTTISDPDQHVLLQAAVGTERGTVRWPKTNPVLDWAVLPSKTLDGESSAQGLKTNKGSVYQEFLEVELNSTRRTHRQRAALGLFTSTFKGEEFEICRSTTDIINERVQWIIVGTHSRKVEGDLIDHLFHQGWVLENEKLPIDSSSSDRYADARRYGRHRRNPSMA